MSNVLNLARELSPIAQLSGRHLPSVNAVGRDAWTRLQARSSDGYDYHCACEAAPPDMFRFFAVGAFDDTRLFGCAPAFEAAFRLDMSLSGPLRRATDFLYTRWPGLALGVMGLGSPHADELALGLHPTLDPLAKARALKALLEGLDQAAADRGVWVLFVKDVTDRQAVWADPVLKAAGFGRLSTLPVAHLYLPFSTEEEYLQSLSGNMRSNLRRKLRKAAAVSVEICSSIDGVQDEIFALRQQTQAQAKANYGDFEELSPNYFGEVMRRLPGARLLLYRLSGELIGFSLVLLDADRLTYKYTGFRYPQARDYNLYFLNWMVMVRLCLENGIQHLHAGETTYLTKVRLGCRLERSWIYFRHRLRLINPLVKAIGRNIAIDRMDPDLRELGPSTPYI